jgi:hypothetical protein
MNDKPKNTGGRSIDQFIITIPDSEYCVRLCIDNYSNYKYKNKFIVNDSGENVCRLTIPLNCLDALINNLKRAADKAKLYVDA